MIEAKKHILKCFNLLKDKNECFKNMSRIAEQTHLKFHQSGNFPSNLVTLASMQFKLSFFKKMGQPRPLFHLFSSFQTHITIFTTDKCEKMSIQYPVPGFLP